MSEADPHGLHTLLLHGDAGLDDDSSIAPPLYPSATFRAAGAAHFSQMATRARHPRFYARYGSPTHARVEALIARLEGTESALAVASGMAAISSAVLALVAAGDHVVAQRSHYMGTASLVGSVLPRLGVATTTVEQDDPEAFARAITPRTRVVLLESPSNPLLRITDLAAVARIARERGATTIADNTFATPINQRPASLGVDVVVHSATKFLGGHHDLIAGAIAGPAALIDRIWETVIVLGGTLGAFEAWLLLRGLRTLGLRVARQNESALALAKHLAAHPAVARVHYPGLPAHPGHPLAGRQMSGYGAVLAVVPRGGMEAAQRFMQRLELFAQAVSLGGVESLAMHAATAWAGTLTADQAREAGVDPGLVRLSIGLEDPADLIRDLDRALA